MSMKEVNPMNPNEYYESEAKVFKALCDPNRLMIIDRLRDGEMCACKILEELAISQSTLSHHMKILCESGLVESARVGKWTHYSLNAPGFERAAQRLSAIATAGSAAEAACCCSEKVG